MKRHIIFLTLLLMHILLLPYSYADEDWRVEFDYLCSKTEEAIHMTTEDLKDLVARCDKLKSVIEASDNPQKKVFLKRLDMCRNLFIYTIEVKNQKKKPDAE